MKHIFRILCTLAMLVAIPVTLWGASRTGPQDALPAAWLETDYLLLGEVHDNRAGHALRLRWLQQLVQQRKVALVFEQFDLESQTALDRAVLQWQSSGAPADDAAARAIAEAAAFNFKGWKWPLYAPVITLALHHGLPMGAANLSRAQMGAVMGGDRPSPPEPDLWGVKEREALLQEVREGHCNLMPEAQLPMMAAAQRARDDEMARAMIDMHRRTGLPVVLLAGNGHLRKDLAVPVWLRQLAPQARVVSAAILEQGTPQSFDPAGVYDAVSWVPAEDRPDPCVALRQRLSGPTPP
ncbi:MAG: ChaN family lipoprotein [Burkholderiales bacterium]